MALCLFAPVARLAWAGVIQLPATRLAALQFYKQLEIDAKARGGDAWRESERWLGRNDLFYLMVRLLRRPDVNKDWLFDRCREVQDKPDGCLDLWARGHYKSTIQTFGKTIQDILTDSEITFGIFSHTRPIAKGFLLQIKRELEDNEWLKHLYPDVLWADPRKESPRWSEDGGLIVKRKSNPKESTLEAHGLVDGQPTSKHFKVLLYDDVVTLENVTTPEQVEKTTKALELSYNLGTSEEHGGRKRFIGTRYSLHDSYSAVIDRGGVDVRIYPATHNGRFDGVPVFLSDSEWHTKLREMSRSTISAQLLQNPLADEDATFRTEWLRAYEVRPRTLNVYIMCDPSKGRSATSDNTAIAVIGISATGGKYLIDGACHRMTLSQRWVMLRTMYHRWSEMPGVQHVAVGYERFGAQSDDEYFREQMELEQRRRIPNAMFVIQELNWPREGGNSKKERVERLEPDFRNGRFFLPAPVLHNGVPSLWRVENNPESRTFGEIEFREKKGLTRAEEAAMEGGSPELLARALIVRDPTMPGPKGQGGRYDLTLRFIDEFKTFPFGRHDDMLDAMSRVFDLDPHAPLSGDGRLSDMRVYHDGV
jgi:hypothetical protein